MSKIRENCRAFNRCALCSVYTNVQSVTKLQEKILMSGEFGLSKRRILDKKWIWVSDGLSRK